MLNLPFDDSVKQWFETSFEASSPPQVQGWPAIARGENTLIFAPTGSGKTLAAFLWCINDLVETQKSRPAPGVHTLYISPLKALNNDIQRNLQAPLNGIRAAAEKKGHTFPAITSLVRTGDTPSNVRQRMVKNPPHILITTPESLYLLLTSPRGREIFFNLKYVIIDEIHAVSGGKRGVHLSLSLERLMPLCRSEPVRIGLSATQRPLERIAAFLGGYSGPDRNGKFAQRPVTIVDCGQRKNIDLQVISPVPDFQDLPQATVWPALIENLYKLITDHRTTLVFANMRAQTEKIARLLNTMHRERLDDPQAVLAKPHHGSMSREMRFELEEALKGGQIPAVIATASLELGIDIGSIDLVVQLEAPRSVSGALQRVGRSGHLLNATSKGRILPMYASDLDEALALSESMLQGKIEETQIPENCLDVLAQQIVAETAMQALPRSELFNLLRRSYCYRSLSEEVFNHVIEMLAGRFADSKLPALQPRLNWDRINDKLLARRGARLQAVLNGGVIPDRGYYTIVLSGENKRLGEAEEEFVFESRVGDVFFLGNNEWRIEAIQQDRIVVNPARAVQPRAPFWKGDVPYRSYSNSQSIGEFRRQLEQHVQADDAESWLQTNFQADQDTITNTIEYHRRQMELTGRIATHQLLVLEWFYDAAEDLNMVLHAPFGGRVNGAWAIALTRALEKRFSIPTQHASNNDGFLIRLLDTTDEPPLDFITRFSAQQIKELLIEALENAPVFHIQFRYNAARALMLTRSQPGKRIPLWLQRLRASDLLQAVRSLNDFPIIAETYRSCLEDVFDLPALMDVLQKIENGTIKTHIVRTPYPSPMAAGLIFDFTYSEMYEADRNRALGDAAMISSEFLAQILSHQEPPAILTPQLISASEQYWQFLHPDRQAADAEDLFAIIEKMGPVSGTGLQARSREDMAGWLEELHADGRITRGEEGWNVVEESERKSAARPDQKLLRFLHLRGPVAPAEIRQACDLSETEFDQAVAQLLEAKQIIRGRLLENDANEYICERDNFARLYRAAIAARRKSVVAVDRNRFWRFLLAWHSFGDTLQSVNEITARYMAHPLPMQVFERDVLRGRLAGIGATDFGATLTEFNERLQRGELVLRGLRDRRDGRQQVAFFPRGEGGLFSQPEFETDDDSSRKVLQFLKENGASFFSDIEAALEMSPQQVQESLREPARLGLVSCDDADALYRLLLSDSRKKSSGSTEARYNMRRRPPVPVRRMARQNVSERMRLQNGRWYLTDSFAVQGRPRDREEQIEQQALVLLQRYGILVKEWYRHEQLFLPWYPIFQALKRLEWQGRVRRGYFVKGLSGVQFALPQALELLGELDERTADLPPALISTIDPALPFGGQAPWDLRDTKNQSVTVTRNPGNYLLFFDGAPVVNVENYGLRCFLLEGIDKKAISSVVEALKDFLRLPAEWRPRKRIEMESIDGQPAIQHEWAGEFLQNGFEREENKLVLWPSGV